jgi:cytochrome c-type biogenesis protein CcmF
MPLLSASAFLHSTMIQERRGLFRVWNVVLVGLTFFMTIFGTFLTRSGLIASVHSFAQSSIGSYFAVYMGLLFLVWSGLVAWRWPELRGLPTTMAQRKAALGAWAFTLLVLAPGLLAIHRLTLPMTAKVALFALLGGGGSFAATELVHRRLEGQDTPAQRPVVESFLSREFTFLMNNWGLLGIMGVILVATLFPLLGELLAGEKVTVAPPHYNAWVQPLGLAIFFLMGSGSLFGWRKTSETALKNAWLAPIGVSLVVAVAHGALGARLGYAPVVPGERLYAGPLGALLQGFNGITPIVGTTLCAFNATVIVQEFATLLRSRARSGAASPASVRTAGMAAGSIPSAACSPCEHTLPQAVMVARTISRYFRRVVTVGLSRWRFDRMRNNHHDRQVHRPRHDRFHSKFPQGRSCLASFTGIPPFLFPAGQEPLALQPEHPIRPRRRRLRSSGGVARFDD